MVDTRRILAISLIAAVVGSWAYIAGPTINYLHYYTALDQIGITVQAISVNQSTSKATIDIQFDVSNPTPYAGLRFATLAYQAKLPNGTDSVLIWAGYVGSTFEPIAPYSSLRVPDRFSLTGLPFAQFGSLCKSSQGLLAWTFTGSLGLDTRNGDLTELFHISATSKC
jgi:hypothetical protein